MYIEEQKVTFLPKKECHFAVKRAILGFFGPPRTQNLLRIVHLLHLLCFSYFTQCCSFKFAMRSKKGPFFISLRVHFFNP